MKNTKERILKEAFCLFMASGYEKTSIKDLECTIGKTRGAIFYFFKSKQELFEAVIDKYIVDTQSVNSKFNIPDQTSLKDFIYLYIDGISKTMSKMLSLSILNVYKSYFSLYLDAARYYPNFAEIAAKNSLEEIRVWEMIIKDAIKAKEIRVVDEHVYAVLFRSCFLGLSFEKCLSYGLNVEELLKIYLDIYDTLVLKSVR